MKLVYITNQICGPGGLERILSVKASYFTDHYGYEVHIITFNQKNDETFYEFSPQIKIHNFPIPRNPFKYIKAYITVLRNTLSNLKPDITIVCDDGVKGHLIPFFLKTKKPIILERHASKQLNAIKEHPSLKKKIALSIQHELITRGAKKFDAVILLTEGNMKEWKYRSNLRVIPNPLPFFPENLSDLKNKVVISVGNHGYHKGFDRLLKVWQAVITKNPDWCLKIYGKFDPEKRYVKLSKDLGISDRVEFYPPVKDIGSKYQEASIYALPSRTEGFGMVLIEAMSYGVPCVAFDCPTGPRDIIDDNTTGFLVQNGDIKRFGDRINTLIDQYEYRVKIGRAGRRKSEEYLMEIIGLKWKNLFTDLLLEKG